MAGPIPQVLVPVFQTVADLPLRSVLAATLGVALGLFFLAFPETVVRIHTAGRVPGGRHGEYGTDGTPGRYTLLVRALGAAAVLVGLYIGGRSLGVAPAL